MTYYFAGASLISRSCHQLESIHAQMAEELRVPYQQTKVWYIRCHITDIYSQCSVTRSQLPVSCSAFISR